MVGMLSDMIDRRPAGVVTCANAADVAALVRYAAETGTDLAVRGGAHSVPGFGTADAALVADLAGLSSITVDPSTGTASAGGGATWGGFNEATGAHGLATTGGIVSTTGVGGLTLGGGIGYLARGYGLSCDNLLSAQVVTADGQTVTASATEHPDLFWALRGGGGNFGVVTEFTFRVHPVGMIYGGPMFFELSDGAAVLAYFNEFIKTAPREYGGFPDPCAHGARTARTGRQLRSAPVPDQRRLPRRGSRRDRVRAPRRHLRRGDRRDVAGPRGQRGNTRWVRDYHAAIAPHSLNGGYVNFASADDQSKVAANYGANYARLQEVKRRYDPDNLFHLNQNIEP